MADMRKEWFRSKAGKLLLAGLLSFALVGAGSVGGVFPRIGSGVAPLRLIADVEQCLTDQRGGT